MYWNKFEENNLPQDGKWFVLLIREKISIFPELVSNIVKIKNEQLIFKNKVTDITDKVNLIDIFKFPHNIWWIYLPETLNDQ